MVKPGRNKRDGLARRVRLKTKAAVLDCPNNKIILLEAPRLLKSSLTLLILMSSIDCEQSLFCSEIHGEERNEESKTSVTVSLTCQLQVVLAARDFAYHACTLTTHLSRVLRSSPWIFKRGRDCMQSMSSTKKFVYK